jgi:hypothetical protein
MRRDLLSRFERSVVFQVNSDPGCSERMTAHRSGYAGSKRSPADHSVGFGSRHRSAGGLLFVEGLKERLIWGDDTKVRKLSGWRSYRDARTVQQFELEHDFQGPRRRRRRQSTEKLCFAIEIRQSIGNFSPRIDDQLPTVVPSIRSIAANSRSTPKIVQIWPLEPDNLDTFVSSPLLCAAGEASEHSERRGKRDPPRSEFQQRKIVQRRALRYNSC